MKVLKAILNFFKSRKVQIWAACMAVVVVVAFGIMSWVMVANKIVFGNLTFTKAEVVGGETIYTDIRFDFMPKLIDVDTISFSNDNENFTYGTFQLNNNRRGTNVENNIIFKSEARTLEKILELLDGSRKTNAFSQFFAGGESGEERVAQSYTSDWEFKQAGKSRDADNAVWIKIVFDSPKFIVTRDAIGKPWRVETYDENYTQPKDENGKAYGWTTSDYSNHIVNAISIPLGNVKNAFTQQTWYLSIGSHESKNTSSMSCTFTTYGNYYKLFEYVNGIDNASLL